MKDYAKSSPKQKKFRRTLWIKTMVILTLGIMALLLMQIYHDHLFTKITKSNQHQTQTAAAVQIKKINAVVPTKKTLEKKQIQKNKTQFDFYHMLPSMTVSIPDDQSTAVAANTETNYLLQIASTQSLNDAQHLTAQLVKENFPAFIKTLNQSGNTWYRITAGPYQDLNQAKQDQYQLYKKFKVDSVLVTTTVQKPTDK